MSEPAARLHESLAPRSRGDRARARRGPRRAFRITREGRLFVLVSLGVGVGAVNTGNNLLYLVLGLMLSMLLVSGVLSDLVLVGLAVERVSPRRLYAGQTSSFEVVVRNRKRVLPSLSIEALDVASGEGESTPGYFLRVSPEASEARIVRRTPSRRGPLALAGLSLRTRYPFGLIEKSRFFPLAESLLVYPGRVPVRAAEVEHLARGEERPTRRRGPGSEVAGVRGYRAGDEARDVHWRKSASAGELVVRERERDARATLVLDLDNRRRDDDPAWDETFERRIAEVASLAEVALERSVGVEVRTASGSSPRIRACDPIDPLLRFLALLEEAPPGAAAPWEAPSA